MRRLHGNRDSENGPIIDLGWKPQFVMIKCVDQSGSWLMFDSETDGGVDGIDTWRRADLDKAEVTGTAALKFTDTGFQLTSRGADSNGANYDYVYMAVKADPNSVKAKRRTTLIKLPQKRLPGRPKRKDAVRSALKNSKDMKDDN